MKINKTTSIVIIIITLALFLSAVGYFFKPQFHNQTQTSSATPLVTKAEALSKVKNRSEVVKYEADLEKVGSKASFEIQDDGDDWEIQVFEIVKNGDEPSHTATFGWYWVNKKTGEVGVEEFTDW